MEIQDERAGGSERERVRGRKGGREGKDGGGRRFLLAADLKGPALNIFGRYTANESGWVRMGA